MTNFNLTYQEILVNCWRFQNNKDLQRFVLLFLVGHLHIKCLTMLILFLHQNQYIVLVIFCVSPNFKTGKGFAAMLSDINATYYLRLWSGGIYYTNIYTRTYLGYSFFATTLYLDVDQFSANGWLTHHLRGTLCWYKALVWRITCNSYSQSILLHAASFWNIRLMSWIYL